MAETEETPQIDDTRLQAIRRRIEEVVGDAPQLAKLALEQMVTKHNPDLKGTAGSAGRVGAHRETRLAMATSPAFPRLIAPSSRAIGGKAGGSGSEVG